MSVIREVPEPERVIEADDRLMKEWSLSCDNCDAILGVLRVPVGEMPKVRAFNGYLCEACTREPFPDKSLAEP